jgi:hypothetical protein
MRWQWLHFGPPASEQDTAPFLPPLADPMAEPPRLVTL